MGINSKVSRIPFFILYLTLAIFTSYNWIRVILFQRNFEVYKTEQPWDYYLSNLFSKTFGTTQRQYFLIVFPLVLIGLYGIPKIIGKFMELDKKSNIKGDNHVAVILILLIAPTTLGLYKFFDLGWRSYLAPGIIFITLFSFLSWIDEKR